MITAAQKKRLNALTNPPLLKESAKKLKKVKAAILEESELYDQGSGPEIHREYDEDRGEIDVVKTACGTPACLVGWLMWVESEGEPKKYVKLLRDLKGGSEGFVELLGVTPDEANDLYRAGFSDEEWNRAQKTPGFRNEKSVAKKHAMLGAARIDLFIESHRLV